jgi:TolB-like protein
MKRILFLLAAIAVTARVQAQINAPVRLAIVPETTGAGTVADVLTAEFSKNSQVHLLERAEIERVYHEQELSAANRDDLKLGRLLGADGLLLLGTSTAGPEQSLNVRLIAVKPGVVLVAESFSWPVKNLTDWAPSMAEHLAAFLPKLAVSATDAIPISVVNFRSSLQSAATQETEQQLKLLTIERLSREPQLFVLERQRMQLLSEEKELKSDESAFWDGSYLLEGTVDQNGYSAATMTINARLTPPKGGAPLLFEVSGSRTNLAEVVNRLAAKITGLLKVNPAVQEWNAGDEAERYFAEANWAMRWELYPEAQATAESAWALGRRNAETAALRIRAYSQSVPLEPPIATQAPENLFGREITILAVPDASHFRPLNRGMELYCQDAGYILDGTNGPNAEGFTMGLQLLRRTAGLLESYYYAAEMRAGHEEQLADLRERMRDMLTVLDEHPFSGTNQFPSWNDPPEDYQWLKWEEGGICFNQPEEALPMLRRLLEAGYRPDDLPRLVGWSWESRKRIPGLTRQFVVEICSDTNPAVRLEGLYLAVVQAPHDAAGSLEEREQELLSALWENRQWLYRNTANMALVDRLKNVLRHKYEAFKWHPNAYFDREPFAGFRQKLLRDLLANASATNLPVIQAMFARTSEQLETPAQARELIPLLVSYQQKYQLAPALNGAIGQLRRLAGIPGMPEPAQAAETALPAQTVFQAKFIPWNLRRPGTETGSIPDFRRMICRNGTLWVRVVYLPTNNAYVEMAGFQGGDLLLTDFRTSYLAVDPQKGVLEEIPFPKQLGVPNDGFEVSADSLFVNAQGHLYRFRLQGRNWEKIPVPLESSSQLVWLKGRLYVSRSDGLLRVNPDTKAAAVLVSSRRQPALNKIDPVWPGQILIYGRSDGKLGALSRDRCYTFDPDTGQWSIRTLPATGTSYRSTNLTPYFTSGGGALVLLTGYVPDRYLVGYWDDDRPAESLLSEPTPFKSPGSANEPFLKPVHWDWPQGFPLEPSSIAAGNHRLWVLCPRKVWQDNSLVATEPMKFSDDRQATLFCFAPGSRQPLSVPIRFEDVDRAMVSKQKINGRPVESLSPAGGGYMNNWQRLVHHIGNAVFWLKIPEGLVFGAPNYCGHWLIPNSALESALQAQKQNLDRETKTNTSGPASPTNR